MSLPRISIVTSSYNQGKYIGETIESVLAQEYPNVEHIVVDGMSDDETADVLARYPHLRVIREPDDGQADAINKGFRVATGDILAFLNSDDTLLPDALHRVAREIDPSKGRDIVMGRCRFVDDHGSYVGVEHPSHFESFARVLEIWKGHFIPQPAVFWTAAIWKECGPLQESLVLDYDLFCRFARRHTLHMVNQVFANYRLHPESKTLGMTDKERLERCIRVSRRYWGSPFKPLYWKMLLSLARYRLNRQGRSRRLLADAAERWRRRSTIVALYFALLSVVLAPEVAFNVVLYPRIRRFGGAALNHAIERFASKRKQEYPQTKVYLDRSELWDDGWAGPRAAFTCEASGHESSIVVRGWADVSYLSEPLEFTVKLDNEAIGRHRITKSGDFSFDLPLRFRIASGSHVIEVLASTWWVSHRISRSGDYRPLSWRVISQQPAGFGTQTQTVDRAAMNPPIDA